MKLLDRDVSRETMGRLEYFSDLIQKWTKKINLISQASSKHLWDRHIVDSAQLFSLAPEHCRWVDLGSGGGFPAIVIAILAKDAISDHETIMVESDQRKVVFLRTAIRELNLNATVYGARIEKIDPLDADILSARALSDLTTLLGYADVHLSKNGTALFPKGATWKKEHDEAKKIWSYNAEVIKSRTHAEATVLKIKDITRV